MTVTVVVAYEPTDYAHSYQFVPCNVTVSSTGESALHLRK